jgi:hypothetical protein
MIKTKKIKTVKALKKAVGDKNFRVTFVKSNLDERVMDCTFDLNQVPSNLHPKGIITNDNPKLAKVFSINDNGWRSFGVDSLISVEVL